MKVCQVNVTCMVIKQVTENMKGDTLQGLFTSENVSLKRQYLPVYQVSRVTTAREEAAITVSATKVIFFLFILWRYEPMIDYHQLDLVDKIPRLGIVCWPRKLCHFRTKQTYVWRVLIPVPENFLRYGTKFLQQGLSFLLAWLDALRLETGCT